MVAASGVACHSSLHAKPTPDVSACAAELRTVPMLVPRPCPEPAPAALAIPSVGPAHFGHRISVRGFLIRHQRAGALIGDSAEGADRGGEDVILIDSTADGSSRNVSASADSLDVRCSARKRMDCCVVNARRQPVIATGIAVSGADMGDSTISFHLRDSLVCEVKDP
jgi:hypothetical protein